ncbi:hypothetical protein GCM10011608_27930 [Micromonospora sonchi]|uniref:RHS repeat-associated core domain-containing protein n=1 Tax=Micromonospora sonchi TaxID=1763543 RepID=A0A917TYG3_9ACTN|nr:RHS repeat-associated core domain-containing protein [Micromonospora sonchi]GGM41662.1 hypothetical protein GCM10011608_27930 [Micromonospora sonchi]
MALTISDIPVESSAAAAATKPAADEILERPDEMAALVTARTSGKKVRISGMTTDSAEYVAHPDGKIEATVHAGPVRMQRDGGWVEIDLTLQPADDGSVRAKAHPLNLWISGARGKGGDLAAVGEGDRRLTLGWPGELPAPVLLDNRATYPEVAPGIDLVVEATRTGFSQYLTVKSRSAVDRLPALDLPLTGKGFASFHQGSGGELTLKDGKGRSIAVVPAPEMWDARRAAGTEQPTRRTLVGARSERAKGARDGGLVMRLRPDLTWLKDPATQYPVTIDPQINPLYTSFDTYVKEGDSVDRSGASDLQLGLLATTPAVKTRSFVHWPVSALAGKQITAATVYFWNWWSHSCTASSWEIWTTGSASSATRWGTQPTWIQKEATSTQTKGYSSACDDGWVSISGTNFFQRAATAGQTTAYMGVRGTDETSTNSFKQFRSRNAASSSQVPYATVTYNSYPTVGTRSTVPATACVTGSSRPKMNTATPQLRSVIADAEGSPVTAEFEWWTLTGTTKLGSVITSAGASGTTFTATVPAGVLAHGSSYRWRVRGNDGTVNGTWSSFCEFNVDTSIGSPPIITSETYPENAWGGDAGVAGQFTFDANGVADAVAYEYSLDVQPPNRVVNTTAPGAPATVNITPLTPGWHNIWARTRDSAGNVTQLRSYPFKVGSAAMTSPKTGDISGAKSVLSSISASSFTEVTYQWRRAGSDSWVQIPNSHVTYTAGGGAVTWPVPVTGGTVPKLNWDIAATLAAVDGQGVPRDGPLQVRGYFNPNNNGAPSDPVKIRFDRNLASATTAQVGPGSVNLITGNYQLSHADVSVAGLVVSRTLNSRRPSGNADPLFGPGWISGTVVSDAQAPYTRLTTFGSLVQVKLPDDSTIGFTRIDAGGTRYEPEVGSENHVLTFNSGTSTFTLADRDGNVVTFTRAVNDPPNVYTPTAATAPGSGNTTTYSWEKVVLGSSEVMRPTRLLAPVPSGVTCTTLVRGCRAITFTYANTTTATGLADGTWGDYSGRVKQISYIAWDPDLPTPAMRTVVLARYTYDSGGRLRTVSDPRLDHQSGGSSHQVRTVYYYNGDGIITSITPPAQEPWLFSYTTVPGDPGKGRLHKVTRSALSAGTAVQTVVYQVPVSGSGAPYNLAAGETARWGQADAPTDATAIFPATQVPGGDPSTGVLPGSYERATISYMDSNARTVNTAEPNGHIDAVWYDLSGNVIGELTAGNRKRALEASGTDSAAAEAEIASRLSTVTRYSDDGQTIQEIFGPEHDVLLSTGTVVRGRAHTSYTYDEGAPSGGEAPGLPTTERVSVSHVVGGQTVDEDVRTTKTEYDWTLKLATKTIVDPGGLDLVNRTEYDASGRVVRSTQPAGGSADSTPATRVSVYYGAGANASHPECGGRAEWAGQVCRTHAGGPAESAPELLAMVTTYGFYGQNRVVTEKNTAGVQRTNSTSYDEAGRPFELVVSGPGTPVNRSRNIYDPVSGDLVRTQSVDAGGAVVAEVIRGYDSLGRQTSYTDADGNQTTTGFGVAGTVVSIGDPVASQAVTYDGATERRGLPTTLVDSQAGTFQATYDADGNIVTQSMPNGVQVTLTINEIGAATGIRYDQPGCGQPSCSLFVDSVVPSAAGQWAARATSLSEQKFTYDQAGRISTVSDTVNGHCVVRQYEFDAGANRTRLMQSAAGTGGCQGAVPADEKVWAYDNADRATGDGYTYDVLGRTLTQPGVDSAIAGGGPATMSYHANDMVRTISQAGRTATYTVDVVNNRIRSWVTTTPGGPSVTKRHHYSADDDSPVWTDEGGGSITRPIGALLGLVGIFATGVGVTWQLVDLHGNVVAGMAQSGTGLLYTREFLEYGQPRDAAAANPPRYGWLGSAQRAADTPSGVILMGARLYNPATGRFLSVDPIVGGNLNAYEYCGGDPTGCTDTSGMASNTCRDSWWSQHFTDRWTTNYPKYMPYYKISNKRVGKTLNIRCSLTHNTTLRMLGYGTPAIGGAIGALLGFLCGPWCGVGGAVVGVLIGQIGPVEYSARCKKQRGIKVRATLKTRITYTTIYWRWWAGGGTSSFATPYSYGWPLGWQCL